MLGLESKIILPRHVLLISLHLSREIISWWTWLYVIFMSYDWCGLWGGKITKKNVCLKIFFSLSTCLGCVTCALPGSIEFLLLFLCVESVNYFLYFCIYAVYFRCVLPISIRDLRVWCPLLVLRIRGWKFCRFGQRVVVTFDCVNSKNVYIIYIYIIYLYIIIEGWVCVWFYRIFCRFLKVFCSSF